MRTYLSPIKDTTIYERFPTRNTGLDEILEIGKLKKQTDIDYIYTGSRVRALIQFDSASLAAHPTSSVSYYLNLYLAHATDVNRYQRLDVYMVSRSWVEGSGYYYQEPSNVEDGATWQYVGGVSSSRWVTSGSDYLPSPTATCQLTDVPIRDIRIDVTTIVSAAYANLSTEWHGMLIKFPDADESSSLNQGNIKVFSSNTHTVFAPKLEAVWNDQVFSTGSLKPIPNSSVSIMPKNIKEAYTLGEIDKMYLIVRDKYPEKRFDETPRYKNIYHLPSQSYYRITDTVSGVKLYDFDSYSAVNCDVSGSYIVLNTNGLDVNRYYTLELKVIRNGLVFFPEFVYTFKVDSDG